MRFEALFIIYTILECTEIDTTVIRRKPNGQRLYRRRYTRRPTAAYSQKDNLDLLKTKPKSLHARRQQVDEDELHNLWGLRQRRPKIEEWTTIILPSSEEEAKRHAKTIEWWKGGQSKEGYLDSYKYDPSVGYEPYWIDGHWVFDIRGNVSSTKGLNCDFDECPPPYVAFGPICAIDKKDVLKAFDNYCELLLDDCQYENEWQISYRGDCYRNEKNQTALESKKIDDGMYDRRDYYNFYLREYEFLKRANKYILDYYNSSHTTLTFTHHTTRMPYDEFMLQQQLLGRR